MTVGCVATTPMLTESAVVFVPPYGSDTVNEKVIACGYVYGAGAGGMTNVGLIACESDSVTGTPPVCVHVYVSACAGGPSASVDAEPSSVTAFPVCLPVWFGPWFATGATLPVTV